MTTSCFIRWSQTCDHGLENFECFPIPIPMTENRVFRSLPLVCNISPLAEESHRLWRIQFSNVKGPSKWTWNSNTDFAGRTISSRNVTGAVVRASTVRTGSLSPDRRAADGWPKPTLKWPKNEASKKIQGLLHVVSSSSIHTPQALLNQQWRWHL